MAPTFAPAHAGLAEAYAEWSWQPDGLSREEGLAGMRPAALRALELDPLLPEAHAAMGITYATELRWDDSRRSFERAMNSPETFTYLRRTYALTTLVPLGETAKAEGLLAAALVVDPLSLEVRRALGLVQFVGGRFEEAIKNLQQPDEQGVPSSNMLARALTFAGRPEEAVAHWESRTWAGNWELWLMPAYVRLGRQQDVERLKTAPRSQTAFRQARIYAALGDTDRTFEALYRAIDDEDVPHRVAFTLAFPEMELLRGDPRLDALKQRLNLR